MKKTLISLLIGLTSAMGTAHAEDLLEAYQQAKSNDPVVLKAQAQYNAARESITQARASLLPQIGATAGYTWSNNDTISDGESVPLARGTVYDVDNQNFTYGANLTMQLYHHSTWLRMGTAKKTAHQSDIAYQAAKQDLIVRVTQAYFGVLGAQDDLEFAKAEKEAIARQLEQTKQRFAVGLTAITDVHEAQAQFDNALTAEIRAKNNVFAAEEALRVITNVYPNNLSILNTEKFSASRPLPDNVNDWQHIAEEKNLNLIVQKIGMDIAKENISIAKAGHLPTLDLNGNYNRAKNKRDTSFTNSTTGPSLDNKSVGITLTVPIYSGGAISSGVRQAQSNYVAASQDMATTHRDVVRNTRNSYNTVIANVSAIKALEQSVVSAESALKATEAGFEVGTRTIVDVLNSTRNLYNAKRNLANTRYNYILSVLSLKRAGGTITDQDITDINKGLQSVQ